MNKLVQEAMEFLVGLQGTADHIRIAIDEANSYMATLQPKVEALKKLDEDLAEKTAAYAELSGRFKALSAEYETLRQKLL